MLTELRIKNFVLIDTIGLEFKEGLNILTGETGAGKSILIDALGLVLGERISEECIRKGEESGEVEARFTINKIRDALTYLENAGIMPEDEVILRRIFARSGRSRCYINGVSVTLAFLRKLGDMLVDIHGQHDHQTLLNPENQLRMLDAFTGTESRVSELEKKNLALKKKKKELQLLEARVEERTERNEMLRFQLNEIREADLSREEEDELINENKLLQSVEKRIQLGREAYKMIYSGEGAAQDKLNTALSRLEDILKIDHSLEDRVNSLKKVLFAVDDISTGLRDYLGRIQFDPDRLTAIDDRLSEINHIKRKYGGSVESILENKERMQRELLELDDITEKIGSLSKLVKSSENEISHNAIILAKMREKGARILAREVEQQLMDLNMKNVKFEVRFAYEEDQDGFVCYKENKVKLHLKGIEKIEFYITSNIGEELKPLSRIASGGELSRIMLSLKNVLAGKDFIPVLIFDEVDSGIGGGVADVVGEKIKKVAKKHQVFCVTHLPQIASKGDIHFVVEKKFKEKKTVITVKELTPKARVEEIARMAGGMIITDTTRRHAKEMIDNIEE